MKSNDKKLNIFLKDTDKHTEKTFSLKVTIEKTIFLTVFPNTHMYILNLDK